MVIVGMILLGLTGCKQEVNEGAIEEEVFAPEEVQQLQMNATTFHSVVGWLSNEEVVFIEKKASIYELKTFNLLTKETTTIFKENAIMTNVLIHPEKEYLLIHTSTDSSSATVKVISLDGNVQNEVIIESTELEIVWNDVNPLHILFTAFYDDWSFQTFYFNRSNNVLQMLSIEDPFPKWFDDLRLVLSVQEEEEDVFLLYNVETGETKATLDETELDMIMNDVASFDAFCSPDGEKCLTGMYLEKVLNRVDDEELTWLVFEEESAEKIVQ